MIPLLNGQGWQTDRQTDCLTSVFPYIYPIFVTCMRRRKTQTMHSTVITSSSCFYSVTKKTIPQTLVEKHTIMFYNVIKINKNECYESAQHFCKSTKPDMGVAHVSVSSLQNKKSIFQPHRNYQ